MLLIQPLDFIDKPSLLFINQNNFSIYITYMISR